MLVSVQQFPAGLGILGRQLGERLEDAFPRGQTEHRSDRGKIVDGDRQGAIEIEDPTAQAGIELVHATA